jgi:transcriptional regulator with XRE-family HTH domain
MGTKPRRRPKRLGEKLLQIRLSCGLSQNEMIRHLGVEDSVTQNTLSSYELGNREPSLLVILEYARVAGVHVEDLINDNTDLPAKLPGKVKHETGRRPGR